LVLRYVHCNYWCSDMFIVIIGAQICSL